MHTERAAKTGTNGTWIQERGGMGMAKYEGQGKNATRKITWSDGEVWMRQREVSVGECGWVCRWGEMNRSSGLMGECGRDSERLAWVSVGGCVGGVE